MSDQIPCPTCQGKGYVTAALAANHAHSFTRTNPETGESWTWPINDDGTLGTMVHMKGEPVPKPEPIDHSQDYKPNAEDMEAAQLPPGPGPQHLNPFPDPIPFSSPGAAGSQGK